MKKRTGVVIGDPGLVKLCRLSLVSCCIEVFCNCKQVRERERLGSCPIQKGSNGRGGVGGKWTVGDHGLPRTKRPNGER